MNQTYSRDDARHLHNRRQAEIFDHAVEFFLQPIPEEIERRTESIVKAARLAPGARVLDVGTGVGVLIPHLRRAGAGYIVACDLSQQMLAHARRRHGEVADFRHCDILDLPADLKPFDAVFFNAMFGNLYDPTAALCRARELLRPGGQVVISHPMGRAWHSHLRVQHPDMVLRDLPDRAAAVALFEACGLHLQRFVDADELYIAIATAPETPSRRSSAANAPMS